MEGALIIFFNLRSVLLVSGLSLGSTAFADCHWNSGRTFFGCDTLGIAQSVGRTLPVAGDSIRFNPAAIPNVPTSWGLEGMVSSKSEEDGKFQASLLKGFSSVGFGLVNWAEDSFATPNLQRYLATTYAQIYRDYRRSSREGFRFGSSLGLGGQALRRKFRPNLGVSVGQGKSEGSSSLALGLTFDMAWLSLGYALSSEKISPLLPNANVNTLSVGIQEAGFYAGYTYMRLSIGSGLQPGVWIYSLRWTRETWAVHGAMKSDVSTEGARRKHYYGSVQAKPSRHLELGYHYGLYPGAHSLSAQVYF